MFKKLLSLTLVFSLATPSISSAIAPLLIAGAYGLGACAFGYKAFCPKEKKTYFPDGRLKSVYKPNKFFTKTTIEHSFSGKDETINGRTVYGTNTQSGIPDVPRFLFFFGFLVLANEALNIAFNLKIHEKFKENHKAWVKLRKENPDFWANPKKS